MKLKNTMFLLCLLMAMSINAQELEFPKLDASPMDAANFPSRSAFNNYLDEGEKTDLKIKVLYCRPKKKDRVLFGGLVPFGQDWRLGANEATEVKFFRSVEIGGTFVSAGTYTLFAEPHANHWIVKISSERHIGGANNRDVSKDVVRISVPVTHLNTNRESFTIGFQEIDDNNCNMVFEWGQTRATMPIALNPARMASEDSSPMDLVQYPSMSRFHNFIKEDDLSDNDPKVRVVYSRPQKKGRKIFGELLKYGENWRIGANETTEITFFEKVKIGDTEIKAGTYGIIATVNEDSWDIVIHKNLPSWGPANHDAEKNIATINVPVLENNQEVEALSVMFDKKDDASIDMVIAWDKTMVRLPIQLL